MRDNTRTRARTRTHEMSVILRGLATSNEGDVYGL